MATRSSSVNTSPAYSLQLRSFAIRAFVSLIVLLVLIAYLLPMGNMMVNAVSSPSQISSKQINSTIWPTSPLTYIVQGKSLVPVSSGIIYASQGNIIEAKNLAAIDAGVSEILPNNDFVRVEAGQTLNGQTVPKGQSPTCPAQSEPGDNCYEVYKVPLESGTKELIRVGGSKKRSEFVDPNNLQGEHIQWQGNYISLQTVEKVELHPENFQIAWDKAKFPLLFRNTLIIAVLGMIGTLLSSICVGYAFARFPIPGKNILFILLIGTIILPSQVTLIPTFAFFKTIGWVGTFLPLIIPHFFANAYNVFLLRQYFLTLPRELDEAAMIDGAGPFKVLTGVIIPQAWPAIISVAVFHFIFAWNDYFGPLIYLLGKEDLYPISVGVQQFNFQYGPQPNLIQATSLMAMVLPLIIFFCAQRVFMRGVVITGVEK